MRRLPVVTTLWHASPRKRLWIGGGTVATFVLALLLGNVVLTADRGVGRADLGHDFLAFYTAAEFVRDGRAGELYDLDAVAAAERRTAAANGVDFGHEFGPWWNPPVYALALSPLARLPYRSALAAWWAIAAAAGVGSAWLLGRVIAPRSGRPEGALCSRSKSAPSGRPLRGRGSDAGLAALLLLISMPAIQAAGHGQNTFTSLLLLTAVVALWRAGRATAAGLVGGLLFYKPQLAAVLAVVMVLDLGRPALVGLTITGTALLLTTVVTLPGALGDWLHKLPANVRFMQLDRPYLWDRHVTLKAFWRLLLQGKAAGEPWPITTALTTVSVAVVAAGLLWAAVRSRGDAARRDRLIGATVCASPLLMPFYFDYDLLLLAVPAVLYAIDPNRDRRLTAAWAALYVVLYANAPLAAATHVGPGTVLLAVVAAVSIARAIGPARTSAEAAVALTPA